MSLLESLHPDFRIVDRAPAPPAVDVARLRAHFKSLGELEAFYSEAGSVDIVGPPPRHFRIDSPDQCLSTDLGYKISDRLAGAIPIGSDGGGHPIVLRHDGVYRADYGALHPSMIVFLNKTLSGFLANPAPLWPADEL